MTMPAADLVTSTEPVATGEKLVWTVASDSRPNLRYRVDLLANGGLGECSCKDWATRRGPSGRAGGAPGTRAVLCRHLIKVRRFFLNEVLRELAAKEEAP